MTTTEQQTTRATHTPGPWRIEDVCIVGPDSERLEYTKEDGTTDTHPTQLVALPYSGTGRNGEHYAWGANARLIAAAPDLLRELHALVEWVERETDGRDWPHVRLEAARAAIAKATGHA